MDFNLNTPKIQPHLIRDCWSENPSQRPGVSQIRNLIRNMGGRNESLMDHVFRILEHYTTTLQEEVEERTRELLEEKKRSDVLLYRLLPRQIAVSILLIRETF
jgi:hypothetical protein